MSTTELWFDDSSDDERLVELARSRKQLRDASKHLEMASTEFLKNFRLSKEPFVNLLSSTENQLQQCTRAKLIPNILKLATVLRVCAQGSYQLSIGNEGMLGLAQPNVYDDAEDIELESNNGELENIRNEILRIL
ncbi:uncharacterized protein LOC128863281 [Anastrepha ludens]|uniref:uncharacterized protein LOC128856251 n=1 Tax=Anastrepha ludens TaxID=28586 RepID=UPI0023AE75C3|nr:uncharacterized protein LOC128856251 [Anastrepha ludens]XP_053958357.1 uncharacterized protein LOC128863281 [Anastrepha ludens]